MKDEDPETISELFAYVIGIAPYEFARRVYKQRPPLTSTPFGELASRFGLKPLFWRPESEEDAIANIKPEYRELAQLLILQCKMSML